MCMVVGEYKKEMVDRRFLSRLPEPLLKIGLADLVDGFLDVLPLGETPILDKLPAEAGRPRARPGRHEDVRQHELLKRLSPRSAHITRYKRAHVPPLARCDCTGPCR
jgi:hypothetical protein